jgi:hypothetical protein
MNTSAIHNTPIPLLSLVHAAHLEDLLFSIDKMSPKTVPVRTGDTITDKPNPEYIAWMTRDQSLLGYLVSCVTNEVLMGLTTITTSAAAWRTLEEMLAHRTFQ